MYHFIVNPNARTGQGMLVWKKLYKILLTQNKKYQIYFTKYKRHATKIVEKITNDPLISPDNCIIVALGGDGTINEVVNGISDLSKVTLAYIPIGSSNDFARSIGLSTDPVVSLLHILAFDSFTHINIGEIKYQDHTRRFSVSSGMGYDAQVCHEMEFSSLKQWLNRIKLGKLSYVGIALKSLILQTPSRVTLSLDFNETHTFEKVYFVAAMNLKYEGGGLMFCPEASCNDNKIDLIVAEGFSKWKVLFLLPLAFQGKHIGHKGIHTFQCQSATFTSSANLPIHTDGEPVPAQNELHISVLPKQLRLLLS